MYKKLRTLSKLIIKVFLPPEKYAKAIGVNIGDGCYLSTKEFSSEPYLITIGNNVRIAKNVCFFTHGGIWPFRHQYPDLDYFGKISIGNNCYIGQGTMILPGVTIEDNCIIGAGSVVTKSIKKGSVAAGNPAKIINRTEAFLENIFKLNCNTKKMTSSEKRTYLSKLPDERFLIKNYI